MIKQVLQNKVESSSIVFNKISHCLSIRYQCCLLARQYYLGLFVNETQFLKRDDMTSVNKISSNYTLEKRSMGYNVKVNLLFLFDPLILLSIFAERGTLSNSNYYEQ